MRILTCLLVLLATGLPGLAAGSLRLQDIQYANGVVSIQLNGPAQYETVWWKSANRFAVDIQADGIDLTLREMPVNEATLQRIRWDTRGEDGVRVVLDLTSPVRPTVLSSPGSNPVRIRVASATEGRTVPPITHPTPALPAVSGKSEPSTPVTPSTPPRANLRDIRVEMDEQNRPSRIIVLTDQRVPSQPGWLSSRLYLDFPDAANGPRERIVPVNDPDLIRVRSGNVEGHLRVTLDLRRRVGYKISSLAEETGIAIDLLFPSEPIDPNAPPFVDDAAPRPRPRHLNEMLVVLDAGHGGAQAGARGKHILEKDANLDITLRLAKLLEAQGARVELTRSRDVAIGLRDRPAMAMRLKADAFISIHCNSSAVPSEKSKGTEVFYRRNDSEAKRLAKCLYDAHRENTELTGRRIKPDSSAPQGGLAVLKNTTVPAVLVEVAFLNHPVEGKLLADPEWRQKVAEGLAVGLKRFAEGQE